MNVDAWRLPWAIDTAPHALLDVIRGCNISCNACYNTQAPFVKPLADVEGELKTLLSLRRLESASLIGGEVLLHPQLCDLVRLIKSHGLSAQICTNGVLLDDRSLAQLKAAGLDMVTVHVDRGQTRPDLPPHPTREQVRELREKMAALIAKHGMDVGLTMTAFEERIGDVGDAVSLAIESPYVHYLLVTLFRDMTNFAGIRGDLVAGMRGTLRDPERKPAPTLTNTKIIRYLREELNLRPFCYLGSNVDADDPRWLSYLVVTRRDRAGTLLRHSMKVSGFEKAFLALSFKSKGRYPMYRRPNAFQVIVQVLMNGVTGGDFGGNARFLARCCRPGGKPRAKRILFQYLADIEPDGTVAHCISCPDAVLKNGKLVPVCIGDYVTVGA